MMNLASRNYEEKRNFIRMRVEAPVAVSIDLEQRWSGTCHDLSGGGMLISLPEPLPLGTELEVAVNSHYGHSPMLRALTKVRRVQTELPQHCRLGLEIITLLD